MLPRVRLGLALAVILAGSLQCTAAASTSGASLRRFSDCASLEAYLEDQIMHPAVAPSTSGPFIGCDDAALNGNSGKGEPVSSTTTTAVPGVDEPDFEKSDGERLYLLRRGSLVILRAQPADNMAVLSTTQIAGVPFSMLINADDARVLVLSRFQHSTLVKLFDVSDATAPREERNTLIGGSYLDARQVGTRVLVVTSGTITVDVQLQTTPFSDDVNRAALERLGLTRLLPSVSDFIEGVDQQPRVDTAVACENTYAPASSD
ncbi:MAG TPA: beta-propeller domain-containing protein, partial [Myxococcota bacterium]